MNARFGPLVQTSWLLPRLGEPDLVVVDCRFVLGRPGAGRQAWLEGHVPGAPFLDVDTHLAAPPGERGRHPLPDPEDFEAAARRAGIGRTARVVAYDEAGEGGAARLWWLLRHFGHEEVAVLDGGLAGWRAAGGPLEAGPVDVREGDFRARPREGDTVTLEEVMAASGDRPADQSGDRPAGQSGDWPAGQSREWPAGQTGEPGSAGERARPLRLLDARAPERFRGETEPIDPVAGHIPGAANVPFAELAPGGRFPPRERLRERLGGEPFVAYCGAGVEGRLYPGSWSEWSRRELPVATGGEPEPGDHPGTGT